MSAGVQAPVRVIVYAHTHWDREWWATFQATRFRLVQTVDRLLDVLEAQPDFSCFVLDGQDVVLEDYLEIRPEQRERLVALVRAGRIHVGPWYVLADQFLTSGEAVIRNLWLGERVARRLGVENRRVGYLPDQFGHIAQMPQILRGFGIDSAVVWRGFGAPPPAERVGERPGDAIEYPRRFHDDGSYPDEMRSEFWWEAPDGTRVLGVYLALEYYRGHHRREDPEERARRFVEYMRPYATSEAVLEPYGGDHLPVDPRLPAIVAEVARRLEPEGIAYEIGSLAEHVERVRAAAPDLDVVWRGEARAYGRRAHLLPGVLSSRLHLKRANRDAQVRLERYAEPFQAFEWLHGGGYEQEYLWTAWRHLVQNHPHDSICGCSIDQVHREMLPRFAQAQQIGELLAIDAMERLAARMRPPAGEPEDAQPVVVFNPLAVARTEAVSVLLDPALGVDVAGWRLLDGEGVEVPFQARPLPGRRLLRFDRADWTEATFAVSDLPAFGYRRFRFERREHPLDPRVRTYTVLGRVARDKGGAATGGLAIGPGRLENEGLVVVVDEEDGTLTVTERATGLEWRGLNGLLDAGDAGDTYNHSAPLGDQELRWRGRPHLEWIEKGPARATLRVTRRWSLPASLTVDRDSRSVDAVAMAIHSDVTLAAGGRRVDIRTHFENAARDHRLQATFPLGAPVSRSAAECAFAVVERPTRLPEGERGSAEPAVPEHPQQSFVSVTEGERGLTIANRGLPEYSVSEAGEVRLTLLRATGWLSRDDLLSRVGGAGPTIATPDAQMLGPVEASYSIIPHAGGWAVAGAAGEAHAFNAEPAAVPLRPQGRPLPHERPAVAATLPPEGVLLEVEGGVEVTAVKRAEDAPLLVVRLLNQSPIEALARVRVPSVSRAAYLLDLRERQLAEFEVTVDGWVEVPLRPWQLVTVGLER